MRRISRSLSTFRRSPILVLGAAIAAIVFAAGPPAARADSSSISLTKALQKYESGDCKLHIKGVLPNPTVSALHIASGTDCESVTIDAADATAAGTADEPLRPVVIGKGGTLSFKDDTLKLFASSFLIKDGGAMRAGSAASPISSQITIIMAGDSSAAPAPLATGSGSNIITETNKTANRRDITVKDGGIIALYGSAGLSGAPDGAANSPWNPYFNNTQQGTKSWTYLARPAGPEKYNDAENVSTPVPMGNPSKKLTLALQVDWQVGDWVSVATTSFSSHQTEIVQICSVASVPDPHARSGNVLDASRTGSGITITTKDAPESGTMVAVSGIEGMTSANGVFVVTNFGDATFSYSVPDASGSYLGGGKWTVVRPEVTEITLCQPLKHYHYGGAAPTAGFFPVDTMKVVAPGGAAINVSNKSKSYYDSSERNYGIDERAEVALLSRNIKLTSLAGQASDANPYIGGHLVATVSNHGGNHAGHTVPAPTVTLVGVELEKFGQGVVGRYPIHLHHAPAHSQILIQDVSVHHSYNKCFVVHGTKNAKLYNNVCVRTVGQGVYLEDGSNITGNQFIRNHVAGTMAANSTFSYPRQNGSRYWDGDNLQAANLPTLPNATNTITAVTGGPDQIVLKTASAPQTGSLVSVSGVTGNTAANGVWTVTRESAKTFALNGSPGNTTGGSGGKWIALDAWYSTSGIPDTSLSGANSYNSNNESQAGLNPGPDSFHPGGFWITNLDNVFVNNSVAGCLAQGRGYWLLGQDLTQNSAYPEFTGNRSHACYNGIDTAPDAINNAYNPAPMLPQERYAPVLILNNNTVTRSRNRGFWGRAIYYTLHNNRFATNPYGVSLAGGGGPEGNLPGYWGLAHANVFAGMTRNNVERYPACQNLEMNWQQDCTDVTFNALSSSWGNYPNPRMNIQGYSYYDGPARIENNRFVNFRFDPTGIYPDDPAARLLTKNDIEIISTIGIYGQLEGPVTNPTSNAAPSKNYKGYAGDPATGWIQSNAQSVPPTQYIKGSVWDNVDFKHQVYDESVNMGVFEDGDKTTVILDLDSRLSGLKIKCANGGSCDKSGVYPVSLNNLDYYATNYSVDEPHSRGPNNFLATSLMSPHKYATLNIEPVSVPQNATTDFHVKIVRDMPAYFVENYPSLFLNGRGQQAIYEPFVMDRMGYSIYGTQGQEKQPTTQKPYAFKDKLLFSYTDPNVKSSGTFFVNRIALYQPISEPSKIKIYRFRRRWGDQYAGAKWPPAPFVAPGGGATCDGTFFSKNAADQTSGWEDCLARGKHDGVSLNQAADFKAFEKNYTDLLNGTLSVADFISGQTYYYDTANNLLYFHMIEDAEIEQQYAPFGTCDKDNYVSGANYVSQIQTIKNFSNAASVKAALNASCLAEAGVPQKNDLFTCNGKGCAAYAVDLTGAQSATGQLPLNAITNASKSSPIVISSASPPPAGAEVVISGVAGNTAANGVWTVASSTESSFTLEGSSGKAKYTSGGEWYCSSCPPQNPIKRSTFAGWNQYEFEYGTPSMQANGLPVVANAGAGNTPPPKDGTVLASVMTPVAGMPPPLGDLVSYNFESLDNGVFKVTGNFGYHCTKTLPWSPVNARGTYPPDGGFTYPLHPSICEDGSLAISGATNASSKKPIIITSTAAPPTGTKVKVTGVKGNQTANGTWTVTRISPKTFSLDGTKGKKSGKYVADSGVWSLVQ